MYSGDFFLFSVAASMRVVESESGKGDGEGVGVAVGAALEVVASGESDGALVGRGSGVSVAALSVVVDGFLVSIATGGTAIVGRGAAGIGCECGVAGLDEEGGTCCITGAGEAGAGACGWCAFSG